MSEGVDTKQRFEVTVPSPSVRLNMGEPVKEKGQPVYGYVGMSLQSDVDLFVDVNKNTFQQGSHVLHQAGGNWFQYADGPMVLSTLETQHFASGDQISMVAGAPYGNVTGLDHGTRVRLHKYNNLHKHYRVEEVQNGLFEFFYGRHSRKTTSVGSKFAYGFGGFSRDTSTAVETDDELKGFRAMVDKSQAELGFAVTDPSWIESFTAKNANTDGIENLEYGFSGYFKRFDPYNITDPSTLDKPNAINKLALGAKNLLAKGRRIVDVMRKVGACITDNAISAQILKLADAMASFGSAWAAMDRVIKRHPFQPVRWVDEYNSGFAARIGAVAEQDAGAAKAKIRSSAAPYALADGDKMKITAPTSGGTPFESAAVVASQAQLDASSAAVVGTPGSPAVAATPTSPAVAAVAPIPGWNGDISIEVDGGGPVSLTFGDQTATADGIRDHLSTVAGVDAELVSGKLRVKSARHGSSSRVRITGNQAVLANLGFASGSETSASGETIDGVAGPTFPVSGGTLTLTPDGASPVLVSFPSQLVDMQALVTAINAAWAPARPAGTPDLIAMDAAGRLRLSVPGSSVTAEASDRAFFEKLGLATAQGDQKIDSGPPTPANNVSNAAEVTAEELVALLQHAASGVTISVSGGAVLVESTTPGDGSHVKGHESGDLTMASKVALDYKNEITGWDRARTDFAVINHELQKLPEDARNLARPITDCLEDVESVLSNLESALENIVDTIPGILDLPGPPAAIGLIAKDGISLGTPDRIVGAAGGGFVFVADGGTGQRDRGKWVKAIEKGVNIVLEWKPAILGGPDSASPPDNLGFVVCSDSAVNLTATTTAELLALGRAKVGTDVMGVGVARVAGSRSAELCGFEKVSIGARAPDKDKAAPDGGRVEIAAHTIAIGAGSDGSLAKFGIHERDKVPLLKHPDKSDRSLPLLGRAWDATLRHGHPKTKDVSIEATDTTRFRVGECAVEIDKDKGLTVGWDIDDAAYQAQKLGLEMSKAAHEKRETEKTDAKGENDTKIAALALLGVLSQGQTDEKAALERENEDIDEVLGKITTALETVSTKLDALTDPKEAVVPALMITKEEIVLGFRKNASGKLADGPHLKITPDGFWLETGETDEEISINTSDGKTLNVFAPTAWEATKDFEVKPTGKLTLEAEDAVSLKGSNVTVKPSGTVKIG